MKKEFNDRWSAIQWLGEFAQSEEEFEILREELTFNHIYDGVYFVHARRISEVVVWKDR